MRLADQGHREKKLADNLRRVGVSVYLPAVARKMVRAGQESVARMPLFPGYVFCSAGGLGNPAVPKPLRSKVAQELRPPDSELLRPGSEPVYVVTVDAKSAAVGVDPPSTALRRVARVVKLRVGISWGLTCLNTGSMPLSSGEGGGPLVGTLEA